MPVLEARSALCRLRHAPRSNFGTHQVILGDSLSAGCALPNGRSSAHEIGRVAQQIGSHLLACIVRLQYRWVPSEWNPADNPSGGGGLRRQRRCCSQTGAACRRSGAALAARGEFSARHRRGSEPRGAAVPRCATAWRWRPPQHHVRRYSHGGLVSRRAGQARLRARPFYPV